MVLLCEKYPEEVNLVREKESNRLGAGKESWGVVESFRAKRKPRLHVTVMVLLSSNCTP